MRSQRHKKRGLKRAIVILSTILLFFVLIIGGFAAKTYLDVKKMADNVNKPVSSAREYPVGKPKEDSIKSGDTFSVLLLGIDTGDLGRDEVGRSDTMIVATINPNTKKTTMISIPRDTRTEIVGYGTVDKINHAYAFGQEGMALSTTENLLGSPIDHYVSINMKGLQDLVDAVGGISINNKNEFEQDGMIFNSGNITLNGEQTLAFSRMRYDDPLGDYGRQARQRDIIAAIVDKILTFSGVTQYQNILGVLENNMTTDISWDNMLKLATNYSSSFSNLEQTTLQGNGTMIDGVSYQEVSAEELTRVQELLKQQIDK